MKDKWFRKMEPEDATRRSPFNPNKIVSNDDNICQHVWLRYSGFDECRFCGLKS